MRKRSRVVRRDRPFLTTRTAVTHLVRMQRTEEAPAAEKRLPTQGKMSLSAIQTVMCNNYVAGIAATAEAQPVLAVYEQAGPSTDQTVIEEFPGTSFAPEAEKALKSMQ